MTRLRQLALAGVLAATAACGTTVPVSQQVGSSTGVTGSVTSPTATAAPAPTSSAASTTGGGGGSISTTGSGTVGSPSGAGGSLTGGGTSPGSTGGASPTTSGGGTPSAAALPSKGRGFDRDYVYVGVTTQKDTQRVFGSVGYSDIDPGDTEAQANAVIASVNARGGLFGRRIKPIFKDVPLLGSAQNPESYASQVCAYYGQDHPVVAVINIVATMDTANFRACFAKARIPLFNSELTATDQTAQSQFAGYLYTTIVPTWDAFAPVLVSRLKAQGYFQGWDVRLQKVTSSKPKLGVLVLDNPLGARIGKIIAAALKAQGVNDVVTFAYPYPGNDINGAITYFQGNGVTHVISSDIELTTFQLNARSQNYYPRYGINTNNQPIAEAQVAGNKSQIGAVGAGWAPAWDVLQAQDPGTWSAGEKDCLDQMKAGQVANKSRLSVAFALGVCDGVQLLVKGALAGKGLDAARIRQGVDVIGPGFSTAEAFASGLRPGRSFLPGAVRDLAWSQACQCYQYTSRQTVKF